MYRFPFLGLALVVIFFKMTSFFVPRIPVPFFYGILAGRLQERSYIGKSPADERTAPYTLAAFGDCFPGMDLRAPIALAALRL